MSENGRRLSYDMPDGEQEIILLENITALSFNKDFDGIPAELKVVAVDAAVAALLYPRIDLFKELERLDQQAADVSESAAAHDSSINGSLIERRDKAKARIDTQRKVILPRGKLGTEDVFDQVHKSRFLTRLDRMLLASRKAWVSLAEQCPQMDQDPTFLASVRLSEKLVVDSFALLSISRQRDPYIAHPPKPKSVQVRAR